MLICHVLLSQGGDPDFDAGAENPPGRREESQGVSPDVHVGDRDGAGVGTGTSGWLRHLRYDDDRHTSGDSLSDPLEVGEGVEADPRGVLRVRPLEPLTVFDGLEVSGVLFYSYLAVPLLASS